MRVLVVGAGGAIGSRLVPQLTEHGHQVTGTSRIASKAGYLGSLGAEPAVLDVLQAASVRAAVAAARPGGFYGIEDAMVTAVRKRQFPLGAAPPRRVPGWLGRLLMGGTMSMLTEARGASNAKAKKELGWTLGHPSWRDGFTAAYGK